jgi:hypothetical protein
MQLSLRNFAQTLRALVYSIPPDGRPCKPHRPIIPYYRTMGAATLGPSREFVVVSSGFCVRWIGALEQMFCALCGLQLAMMLCGACDLFEFSLIAALRTIIILHFHQTKS